MVLCSYSLVMATGGSHDVIMPWWIITVKCCIVPYVTIFELCPNVKISAWNLICDLPMFTLVTLWSILLKLLSNAILMDLGMLKTHPACFSICNMYSVHHVTLFWHSPFHSQQHTPWYHSQDQWHVKASAIHARIVWSQNQPRKRQTKIIRSSRLSGASVWLAAC